MTTTQNDAPITAGVIGLGMIGHGVAGHIVRAGVPLTVFDVRPEAADGLGDGARPAASPAELAAASDVILISVVNAEQVRSVLDGDAGVLSGARPGAAVVLLSTVALEDVRAFAADCAAHGVAFVDAGVTQTGDGRLVSMVGGEDDVVSRVRPVLAAYSKAIVHCGPQGSGMVAKVARNLVTYGCWAVVREAIGLVAAGGVGADRLLEVLHDSSWPGASPTAIADRLQRDPDAPVGRARAHAQKDLGAARALAGELGVVVPIADLVQPLMHAVMDGDYVLAREDARP